MAKGITELIRDFKELHPRAYERIRADAIDEYKELIIARIQSKDRGLYVIEAMDIAKLLKEQNNEMDK